MILPSRLPAAAPSGITYSEHRLIASDETPLFYRRVSPRGKPKAAIVIVHGMGEYGARYLMLAEYLAAMEVECWLPDLRGFGRSGGKRGHVERFSDLQKDLEGLGLLAHRNNRGSALFFLGHSFGGLLASSVAAYHGPSFRLQGLILSSPLFGIAISVPAWQRALASAASFVAPSLTQNNRVKVEYLTHDKSIYQAYTLDKLIHFGISSRMYTEMNKMIDSGDRIAQRIHCPALVLQAGDDRIVLKDKTVSFYHSLASEDKQLEVYEGWYHEILNETNRQAVFAKIGQWIIERI